MATYKVIQDVEAEDKILGPLTLRQFIYAGTAAVCLYFCYFLATHGAAFMIAVFLPIALIAGFFAVPWNRDQPTEVWALARIRFMLKPRRRIWNQSGVKELVTVTAPKREQMNYTDGLSQTEVKSRLHALADTLDSRGWAIKNSAVNLYTQPALVMSDPNNQERLLDIGDVAQPQTPIDIHDSDDMLDEQNNAAAQQMDNMIAASAKAHRQKIIDSLNEPEPAPKPAAQAQTPANNYWFLNQPSQSAHIPDDMVTFNTQIVTPNAEQPGAPADASVSQMPMPNEDALVEELKERKRELPMTAYYGHLHTIQPLSAQAQQPTADASQSQSDMAMTAPEPPVPTQTPTATPMPEPQYAPTPPMSDNTADASDAVPTSPAYRQVQFDENGFPYMPTDNATDTTQSTPQTPSQSATPPVTPTQQAAILQLAHNDDLNVATLAREAQRSEAADGEVVIKLH